MVCEFDCIIGNKGWNVVQCIVLNYTDDEDMYQLTISRRLRIDLKECTDEFSIYMPAHTRTEMSVLLQIVNLSH
jgi:hypothetical protein